MAVDEKTEQQTKVADEVWIATALLHREQPERKDFTIREIRVEGAGGARSDDRNTSSWRLRPHRSTLCR